MTGDALPEDGASWIETFERDLGEAAVLRLLAAAGGQRRYVPRPENIAGHALERELGRAAARWIAERLGGDYLEFPSRRGRGARELREDVRRALLTDGTVAENDLARKHGVSHRHVRRVKARVRADEQRELPLFKPR